MKAVFRDILIRFFYWLVRLFSRKTERTDFGEVLILAPHPDDEILGIGGLLLQIKNHGGQIHIVYLTDGENSGIWPDKNEIRQNRVRLSEEICNKLGLTSKNITRLHLPDGVVPHRGQEGFKEVVMMISKVIDVLKPDAVFATHTLDYWPYDHVACAYIAKEAVYQSENKPQLWYYWVWAWYNIRPWQMLKRKFWRFQKIDIKGQISQKRVLMQIYLKALTPDGRPWSGVLPKSLLKAFDYPVEIIERII